MYQLTTSLVQYRQPAVYNALANITPQRLTSVARGAYRLARSAFDNMRLRDTRHSYRTGTIGPFRSARRGYPSRRPMPMRGFRTSGNGVSTQHDVTRVYKKRRMPRRKRKRWTRFIKKVDAVAERNLGSRTVVMNILISGSNTTSGNQLLGSVALYPASSPTAGGGSTYFNDLAQIGLLENLNANPTAADGATIWASTKIIFHSAILDITFRNSSSVSDGTNQVADARGKMEVDVYEIVSNKQWSDSANTMLTTIGPFTIADSDTLVIKGTGGSTVSLSKRGVTPFDLPLALSQYGIKILKKTKYFVPNQDTFTYQIRDPKRRVITQVGMQRLEGCNKPRWTRHVLIVAKLVPGLTIGTGTNEWTESIRVGCTRKYLYKIEGINDDRDIYLPA